MRDCGHEQAPEELRCASCGYVGRTVLIVETLAGRGGGPDTAEPAEYAWACPECGAVGRLDGVDADEEYDL